MSIQVTAPVSQRLDIEVTNVAGQVVYRQAQSIQPGLSAIKLEVGKLSSGTYMVRLKDENGQAINVQQFIKK